MADKSKSNMSPDDLKKTAGGTGADRARPKIQPVDPNVKPKVGGGGSDTMNDADLAGARGGQGVRATVAGTKPGMKVDPVGSGGATDPLDDRELRRASGGAGSDTGVTLSGAQSGGKVGQFGKGGGPTDPLAERELRRASGGTQSADARRLKADKPGGGGKADTTGGFEPH